MNNRLILITERFPYGKSETFLETEIKYLAEEFSSVLILPTKIAEIKRLLPGNVTVDDRFSNHCRTLNENRKLKFLKGIPTILSDPEFYRQVWKQPGRYLHPTGCKRMAMWAREAELIARFFKDYIAEQKLDREETLFYTYWFHLATVALGKPLRQAKLISRAHGFDLYDERGEPPYSNWKCLGLQSLDKLFLISEDGLNYMNGRYPEYSHKYAVSRLGVKDPGALSNASKDGAFRLVSVAGVREVKRVHLIASAVQILAGQHPNLAIRWDHFGDGPLMDDLKQKVNNELSGNTDVVLHGIVPNNELMEFYKAKPVDLFINVSSSEGVPVSIMEAQAFGIPVMATNVGGTSEIVNDENGVLLSENPSAKDIAKLVSELINNRGKFRFNRKKSHIHWKRIFNADKNYSNFAKMLKQI